MDYLDGLRVCGGCYVFLSFWGVFSKGGVIIEGFFIDF